MCYDEKLRRRLEKLTIDEDELQMLKQMEKESVSGCCGILSCTAKMLGFELFPHVRFSRQGHLTKARLEAAYYSSMEHGYHQITARYSVSDSRFNDWTEHFLLQSIGYTSYSSDLLQSKAMDMLSMLVVDLAESWVSDTSSRFYGNDSKPRLFKGEIASSMFLAPGNYWPNMLRELKKERNQWTEPAQQWAKPVNADPFDWSSVDRWTADLPASLDELKLKLAACGLDYENAEPMRIAAVHEALLCKDEMNVTDTMFFIDEL